MSYERLVEALRGSFLRSVAVVLALTLVYMAFEASVLRAGTTDQFTVTQTITEEISVLTDETDIQMQPDLPGQTGGHATGTAQLRVLTNNATGYNVTIQFSSTTAMSRNGVNQEIFNYSKSQDSNTTSPTVAFTIGGSGTQAEFGYSVDASTSADVDAEFQSTGTLCNTGGGSEQVDECWQAPSTTANVILSSSGPTAAISGATSTVKFIVKVPSNPSPTLPEADYVATVTLTAAVNP